MIKLCVGSIAFLIYAVSILLDKDLKQKGKMYFKQFWNVKKPIGIIGVVSFVIFTITKAFTQHKRKL